jgi:hypothetical protein
VNLVPVTIAGMKTLTCRDLGGACEAELTGETFLEIGQKSHAHVMEQIKKGDAAHVAAMQQMIDATPEQQQEWMKAWQQVFDNAPLL